MDVLVHGCTSTSLSVDGHFTIQGRYRFRSHGVHWHVVLVTVGTWRSMDAVYGVLLRSRHCNRSCLLYVYIRSGVLGLFM